MEPLRKQQVNVLNRRAALSGMALAALAPLGCLKHFGLSTPTETTTAAPAPQGRLISTWEKRVVYAPDAYNGGAIIPGLVGRVFLFGPDMAYPYIGDGELKLDLWDNSARGGNAQPRQMEHYIIAADVLKQFAKKDAFGDGYSIFFPWASYRQDVKQIYITMLYTSAKGEKFFHQSGTFAVDHVETAERIQKGMSVSNPVLQASATQR